jgi:phosphatidylserine/phosphatidylglycerophosphate/cardiolipin synthase-like enzyme
MPALRVTLLLNLQRKRGDTTASEQLVRRFADHCWKTDWPGSSRPSVFYDPRALDAEGPGGVLHAKVVVADDEVAFITSANLTEATVDRNIETWCSDSRLCFRSGHRWLFSELDRARSTKAFAFGMTENVGPSGSLLNRS